MSAGRFVIWLDRLFYEGLAFVWAGYPSCPDDVTLRPCANFNCDVADLCKQIDSALISGASNAFLYVNVINHIVKNVSWYIMSDCLVQQIYNQSPPASYFQQFTGSCYSLWITGNSLWHRDYPAVFSRKYIFEVLINIFFKLKYISFPFL